MDICVSTHLAVQENIVGRQGAMHHAVLIHELQAFQHFIGNL